jgi:small subunit ribosomal protein S13
MLIIYGVTLVKNKQIRYALPLLYGVGVASAKKICLELGYAPNLKIVDLTEEQQFELAKKIKEEYRLENNLKEEIKGNIQRYITNGSIRGFRHRNKLPVRGQRTQSNAKTPRRVIMGIATRIKKA